MLWNDRKFQLLIAATFLVGLLEVLSLVGLQFPPSIAVPLFLTMIVGIGHQTLIKGTEALFKLDFGSINLLMLLAVIGAFYLGKYEEAAVVIVLYTLAEKLEDIGIAKSKSALNALMAKMPKEITVKGKVQTIPISEVAIGDIIQVKPGEMIALDGIVKEGFSSVDESTITGEPVPKDKSNGDPVFAGTLNNQGFLEIEVTQTEKNSAISKIQELTFQATRNKADTQKFIEKFSKVYTPTVILIAFGVIAVPTLFFEGNFDKWLLEGLSILVIACPCALVISTPISIYSAIGAASKLGVLIKGGRYLEAIGQIRAIALDKTRTLTIGRPYVTDVMSFGKNNEDDVISCAAGLESYSEHPLSESIVIAAQNRNQTPHKVENFENIVGKGIKGDCLICQEKHHCIGKLEFILEEHHVPEEVVKQIDKLQNEGKTVVVVSSHKEVEGIIGLSDEIRPESAEFCKRLREQGVDAWMLTGDHIVPAQAVARELGISQVQASLLPEDKASVLKQMLDKYEYVAMVGDGINDAPALALSSVGITMSQLGSDTAIEAASMVILNDNLLLIPRMIDLGRRTMRIIRFNTFWAIAVKLIFVALAVVGHSNLVLAILADVGVTLFVMANSLRLLKT